MMKNSNLKIVTLGAGTGQAKLLLGLKKYFADLTCIVNVTDNGGHSGILRKELDIPQVADGRQLISALAESRSAAKNFEKRDEDGFCRGNFYLARIVKKSDLARAFEKAGSDLKCQGKVLPSTLENVQVGATLANGKKIIGEWEIIKRRPEVNIKSIFLEPKAKGYSKSRRAIEKADWTILSPASLFTGLLPIFLTSGIKESFKVSRAKIIYVANLMTMPGQTIGFSLRDHLRQIEKYSGRRPDYVVVNSGKIPRYVLDYYKKINSQPILITDMDEKKYKIIRADLIPASFARSNKNRPGKVHKWTHWLTHDSDKSASAIKKIIIN